MHARMDPEFQKLISARKKYFMPTRGHSESFRMSRGSYMRMIDPPKLSAFGGERKFTESRDSELALEARTAASQSSAKSTKERVNKPRPHEIRVLDHRSRKGPRFHAKILKRFANWRINRSITECLLANPGGTRRAPADAGK